MAMRSACRSGMARMCRAERKSSLQLENVLIKPPEFNTSGSVVISNI